LLRSKDAGSTADGQKLKASGVSTKTAIKAAIRSVDPHSGAASGAPLIVGSVWSLPNLARGAQ
jgi:hypothetical protein